MRQRHYSDGSPSREFEDDDELHETRRQKMSIVGVRDELNNLNDLIDVCGAALLGHENRNQQRIQRNVAHVLYFFVQNKIKELEQELENT